MSLNDELKSIHTKLDTIIENQHKYQLETNKKVNRNTLVINCVLWVAGILFTLILSSTLF